ncbi:MAG: translation elongation factor Ts [Alphaproteobacteria bacterium]
MEITAALVKTLREKTGAGMMDCKAALAASGGDMEGAIKHLREKGLATAAKRAGKVAAEGVVAAKLVSPSEGLLVELNCETDFVAKTEPFQDLARAVLDAAAGKTSIDGTCAAADAGLDAAKLASGKTVGDAIAESIASMGESIVARRVARLAAKPGEGLVGTYVHAGGKIGVLVLAKTTATGAAAEQVGSLLRDVAMQVAAINPRFTRREEVPAEELEREREINRTMAEQSGKPPQVIEKMIAGRLEKFYSEFCLVEQEFIKDPQLTVGKLVAQKSKETGAPIEIVRFVRLHLGESSGEAGEA